MRYLSPLPPYPPICGQKAREQGITNNLMDSYVSMQETREDVYGRVLDLEGILAVREKCDAESTSM